MSLTSAIPGIDPGQFRHLVTLLEESTSGSDASGAPVSWAVGDPPLTAYMKIESLKADEIIKAGLDVSQVDLKLTGWYRPQFTAQSRIQAPSGNVYIVQAVQNVLEMNIFMVLLCLGVGANN
jgi:head-tail adaptor